MQRIFMLGAITAAALLAKLPAAQAEFFSLSGRFQCLESGAAVCGDAQQIVKQPAASAPAIAQADIAAPIAVPTAAAPIERLAPAATPAARAVDPVQVVATRIQARRPSSNDIAWLAQAARHGDARAIELLAWCKLNAIGMARDPVEAFLLYGAASSAALPNARDNQRLIFERDLDSGQRQQVLELANAGVTLAQLMPGTR